MGFLRNCSTHRALHGVLAQLFHQIFTADDNAALRTSEQLVTAEADQVGALRQRIRRRGFAR